MIQWAKPFQPLNTIPEPLQQELGKTFRKWSSRWQKQLPEEDLPPVLKEILQAKLVKQGDDLPNSPRSGAGSSVDNTKIRFDIRINKTDVSRSINKANPQANGPGENRHERSTSAEIGETAFTRFKNATPGADISDLLKQIQAQFDDLREELQTARNRHSPIASTRKSGRGAWDRDQQGSWKDCAKKTRD